jgi:hypothetical protein
MHCTNCDSTNHADANFCSSCGTKLADAPALGGRANVDIALKKRGAGNIWRDKTDEELLAAALKLSGYTLEGRKIIQDELDRLAFADWPRGLGRC